MVIEGPSLVKAAHILFTLGLSIGNGIQGCQIFDCCSIYIHIIHTWDSEGKVVVYMRRRSPNVATTLRDTTPAAALSSQTGQLSPYRTYFMLHVDGHCISRAIRSRLGRAWLLRLIGRGPVGLEKSLSWMGRNPSGATSGRQASLPTQCNPAFEFASAT